jgi:glucokinase
MNTNDAQVALYLPRQNNKACNKIKVLAGDIGGTKTNLGLFESVEGKMKLMHENTYHSNKFPAFTAIVHQFLLDTKNEKPDRISIGIAGPVINKTVQTTNLRWQINADDLQKEIGTKEVALLNDLEANAYGLAGLGSDDIVTIYDAKNTTKGNIAIIAPGTGLGEAGLFWDGKNYHPFATEGGHCSFSQQSDLDLEIYKYLQKKYNVVSWEHLVSGPAIFTIYKFLRDIKKREEPHWLEVRLNADDPSAVISNTALEGLSEICDETMKLFARFLARESYNLVLKLKSTGGLYLGGGIPPKIIKYIQSDIFYETFKQSDRMDELISTISIKLITNPKTALMGAAYFGAFGLKQ